MNRIGRSCEADRGLKSNRPRKKQTVIIFLFFLSNIPFAFDFKSEGAGAAAGIQGSLLFCYLVTSIVLFVKSSNRNRYRVSLAMVILPAWFLIESAGVGLADGQDTYTIFVNCIPVMIYTITAFLTQRVIFSFADVSSILKITKILCFLYIITRVLVVAIYYGIDFGTIRYQIIGTSQVPALGLLWTVLLFKMTALDMAVIIASFAVAALSVTRSLIAILAAQALVLVQPLLSKRISYKLVLRLAFIMALPVAGIVGDQMLGSGLTDRWVQRLEVSSAFGFDPTLLTREAENEFMFREFAGSLSGTFVGNGIAAETSLIGESAGLAARLVGQKSVDTHSMGFGHNNHLSLLFVAGLLGGLPLLVLQFWQGIQAARIISTFRHLNGDVALRQLGVWGATIVIGMLAFGFLAGSFGDRGTCLWYGIGTGFLAGVRELAVKSRMRRNVLSTRPSGKFI